MRKSILIAGLWVMAWSIGMSQNILPADVSGVWKVVGGIVNTPPAPNKEGEKLVENLKSQFFHSVFEFKSDHNFRFDIGLEDLSIKKGHWKYNASKQQYEIQEWADKDKNNSYLITLQVLREGDKTYIIIPDVDELPPGFLFKLEVVKVGDA
jgi:hypothetical protein